MFGRRRRLTNLDKILFEGGPGEPPVTKRELIAYAARIAPVALPYLAGRALNLHRFPNGARAKGLWHQEVPERAPGWLPRWDTPDAGADETRAHVVVDEPAALIWLPGSPRRRPRPMPIGQHAEQWSTSGGITRRVGQCPVCCRTRPWVRRGR